MQFFSFFQKDTAGHKACQIRLLGTLHKTKNEWYDMSNQAVKKAPFVLCFLDER